jgi:peptidoglycan hydrolase-like protein with peptidoglycan-binding domain
LSHDDTRKSMQPKPPEIHVGTDRSLAEPKEERFFETARRFARLGTNHDDRLAVADVVDKGSTDVAEKQRIEGQRGELRIDRLGYGPSLVQRFDGRIGPETRGAVRQFQRKNGLRTTAMLDQEALQHLMKQQSHS